MMQTLLEVGGRLHPVVLHAPIGMLLGLAGLEAWAILRRKPAAREGRVILAWLAALAAGAAVGSGLLLERSPDYDADAIWLHKWLGIALGVLAVVVAVLQTFLPDRLLTRSSLVASLCVMMVAGHLGGSLTHGEGFLTEPLVRAWRGTKPIEDPGSQGVPTASATSEFDLHIAPILADRCIDCHGPSKQKGGLAMDSPEALLAGGESGPALDAIDPAVSELLRRMELPLNDPDRMPPKSRSQPAPQEVARIRSWLERGASFVDPPPGAAGVAAPLGAIESPSAGSGDGPRATRPDPPQPLEADVAALRSSLVHVEPLAQGSPYLVVDASVAAGLADKELAALLRPIAANIIDLSVARTDAGTATFEVIASMPALGRLNLSGTKVTDELLARVIAGAPLRELVATQVPLTDASAESIGRAPMLERVNLWRSGLSDAGVVILRERLPRAVISVSEPLGAEPLETEGELALTSDAPAPGEPETRVDQASLRPINTVCPVSGRAVDPAFAVVHKGRVVAFCCRNCAAQFWEDPARYESKIAVDTGR